MTVKELKQHFKKVYQKDPTHLFYCPGRVNLIGEHIDYNGGKVMPCAISVGTWVAVSENDENILRFNSLDFPEKADIRITNSFTSTGSDWYNYPLGVINEVVNGGHKIGGLDMLFYGNIPIAAGLSSSASIEVLMGQTLNLLYDLKIPAPEIARMSQHAENNFVGVNCGIMDQFAVAMGKKDNAIWLDCDTLEYEYVPFKLDQYGLVVINTNKPRRLAESKYNERFSECREALRLLQQKLPVNNLCEITVAQFELNEELIKDPVLRKRAKHVIHENARVSDAIIAMQTNDLEVLGKLMYASHRSLKEDYEVSCTELDTIVDFCKEFKGCIGSRMTGAGFGGCAIALIDRQKFNSFSSSLEDHYQKIIGYSPTAFLTSAEEGAHRIIE
jgi:galactokinase